KARHMVSTVEKCFNANGSMLAGGTQPNETNTGSMLPDVSNIGVRKLQVKTDLSPIKNEENHARNLSKRDRTARLLYLQILLWHHSQGIDVKEIARSCAASVRTTYRDLVALESELKVPIWQERSKRGLMEGHFLPPVAFRQEEAINIFIASRLMQNYSYLYNP